MVLFLTEWAELLTVGRQQGEPWFTLLQDNNVTLNQQTMQELLQRQLTAYRRLNEWEMAERAQQLPLLTAEEGVRQYLAMCELVAQTTAVSTPIIDQHKIDYWRERAQMIFTYLQRIEAGEDNDETRPTTSSF